MYQIGSFSGRARHSTTGCHRRIRYSAGGASTRLSLFPCEYEVHYVGEQLTSPSAGYSTLRRKSVSRSFRLPCCRSPLDQLHSHDVAFGLASIAGWELLAGRPGSRGLRPFARTTRKQYSILFGVESSHTSRRAKKFLTCTGVENSKPSSCLGIYMNTGAHHTETSDVIFFACN